MLRRMPLGSDYAGQSCSLARTLEIVGERWTLLILRDLFFGVRRFSDLQRHLDIPRAVLSARIASLVQRGLVERRPYRAGRDELLLTERGVDLWPAVHALMQWGEKHESPGGARRVFVHVECGTEIGPTGMCVMPSRRACCGYNLASICVPSVTSLPAWASPTICSSRTVATRPRFGSSCWTARWRPAAS